MNAKVSQAQRHIDDGEIEILRGGDRVFIRPMRTTDIEMERTFIEGLSPHSRRFRFLETMLSPSEPLLRQMTTVDPRAGIAFVAVIDDALRDHEVGVGRFSARPGDSECEFALAVSDAWQNKGLGTHLMHRLVIAARARGITTMYSSDSSDNDLMRKFAAHLHLQSTRDPDDATQVIYSMTLLPSMPGKAASSRTPI